VQTAVDPAQLQHAAEAACRAALRAGLQEVDARDLAQDALLRALSSAQPPDGVPLAAWVYGIARNLGRDHAKSAKRRELLVESPPEAALDDNIATVLAVRHAVNDLPDPLRDVITLHELEEHTLDDTARALQIPFDTAKDRLRRARDALRLRLADSDRACAHERGHSRRRAAAHGAAIVAGLHAILGSRTALAGALATIRPARGLLARGWVVGLASTALVGAGFVAGRVSARSPATVPSPQVVVAQQTVAPPVPIRPEPSVASPSGPAASPLPAPPASPSALVTSQRSTPTAPAAEPEIRAERLVIDRARAGIQRGMFDEALVTLMSHQRQFPDGKFAEERDVLTIEAYIRAGNTRLAQRRIDEYRVVHATGVLREKVEALALQLTPR
jgi:RNA polymerase sigma factor (sigma-70 family)